MCFCTRKSVARKVYYDFPGPDKIRINHFNVYDHHASSVVISHYATATSRLVLPKHLALVSDIRYNISITIIYLAMVITALKCPVFEDCFMASYEVMHAMFS